MNISCYLCNTNYTSPTIYWRHLQEEHELTETGKFVCTQCNHNFHIRRTFRAHVFRNTCNTFNLAFNLQEQQNQQNEELGMEAEFNE